MAGIYTDHDVSAHTAAALRRHGHDVITTRELHQQRAADYRQLLTAAERDRILITHNEEDYALLHGAWMLWSTIWRVQPQHSGILIIPQWTPTLPHWAPAGAARELTTFIETRPTFSNECYVWRRTGWQSLHP